MTDQWVRYFSVTDPRRHTKGFTVYKVTSTVFPKHSPEAKTEVTVWKRYKEFQKLFKDLKSRHEKLYLQDRFPLFSKPCLFGRFESNVIEERRLAAQTLLDFAAKHPPLFTSQACVKFFERGHKVSLKEEWDVSSSQKSLNLPEPLSPLSSIGHDVLDTVSHSSSSSPSTLTDTDSTTSTVNSPVHLAQERLSKPKNENTTGGDSSSLISMHCCPQSGEEECGGLSIAVPTTNKPGDGEVTVLPTELSEICLSCTVGERKSPIVCQVETSPSETLLEASSASSVHINESAGSTSNSHPKEESQSFALDYITDAGYHISEAVEHETNARFELAFSSYKAAISCLLSGVQDDPSEDRKSLVQRKASQYLLRAEELYHNHLDGSHNSTKTISEATNISQTPETMGMRAWKSLEAPVADLKIYKVLGIVSSSLILALNTRNDSPYIIKVLHKSSCPVDRRIKSIVPTNVPFMCRLHNYIENDSAVYLILEQARGGRLWDLVSPYFEVCQSPRNSRKQFTEFLAECAEAKGGSTNTELCKSKVALTALKSGENHIGSQNGLPSELLNESGATVSCDTMDKNIMLQTSLCDAPNVVQERPLSSSTTVCSLEMTDVLPVQETSNCSETENILKKSQKLLDLVNITLCRSEEKTKALLQGDTVDVKEVNHGNTNNKVRSTSPNPSVLNCTREDRLSLLGRDHKRSASRERKSPSTRHSRSRLRFSCDDMFEGRARALSRSLDREALQRTDHKSDQTSCVGLPPDTVRLWAAQLLLALDALHRWGVVIGDLRPDNLLLGAGLNLILTYQCQWVCVDHLVHPSALEQLYAAPEISSIQIKTVAADWWSYGAILFELLSGETLYSCHPGGLHSYSTLHIPSNVCEEGVSLLHQLLRFDPQSRLGVGPHGVARLKAHPFFRGIEWNKVLLMSASV